MKMASSEELVLRDKRKTKVRTCVDGFYSIPELTNELDFEDIDFVDSSKYVVSELHNWDDDDIRELIMARLLLTLHIHLSQLTIFV